VQELRGDAWQQAYDEAQADALHWLSGPRDHLGLEDGELADCVGALSLVWQETANIGREMGTQRWLSRAVAEEMGVSGRHQRPAHPMDGEDRVEQLADELDERERRLVIDPAA